MFLRNNIHYSLLIRSHICVRCFVNTVTVLGHFGPDT